MIKTSCHCGSVKLEINADLPNTLTSCNCSVCRRYGSLLAYFSSENVKILTDPNSTNRYIWGDKKLALVRCSHCGCFSHWESLDPDHADHMGINARLFENVQIDDIKIRRFDGANTWKYLD